MTMNRYHFGKAAVEKFLINSYTLQPMIDPDIRQIRIDFNEDHQKDLIAYIYARLCHDLIYFPFQGNRVLSYESIKKAEKLKAKLFFSGIN